MTHAYEILRGSTSANYICGKIQASHQLHTWHKINGWAWKYIMIWVYLIIVLCRFISSGPNTCRKSKCGGLCPLNAWQSCTPWSSGKATWRREKFRGLWSVLWMKFNYGLQNVFLNVCFWWLPSGTQILITPTCPCVMSTLGPALSGCRSEAHRYVGPTSDDFWIYNLWKEIILDSELVYIAGAWEAAGID